MPASDREFREALGYPRPPLVSENMTREAYRAEVERWRGEMIAALELDINTIEHLNRTRGWDVSTDFEREMLEWVRAFPSERPIPIPPEIAS